MGNVASRYEMTPPDSINAWYGYRPDRPDFRDLTRHVEAVATLPGRVDLRASFPSCFNQGNLGSCTANALVGLFAFLKKGFMGSRLFVYYNERAMEGTINSDAGAEIRDGIKSVVKQGVPPEKEWKYVISRFTAKPPVKAYKDALLDQALKYERIVQTLAGIKQVLAGVNGQPGLPFVFGFTCYESFESSAVAKSGILPMPQRREKVVGGHAVVCCGYDDKTQSVLVRNSWGTDWGQNGYFWMPYAYITNDNLADDMWAVQTVES